MSDIAIRAQGLGKAYTISHQTASGARQYRTLREDLVNLVRAPFRRGDGTSRKETVWALKDVSFEVERGEVLGIIGRNGAGKSTLLKILSRINRPTEGYADVFGRVGSLLEVGTGFHPELTGRENVFLSGAVLGMTRAEVRQKFDEIVAFAEIERFLDTPVKRYSSGMYMRLAFAVAAHLEPEILLVDEVLAVGDAAFQKKCLGKMGDVAEAGRTVLFVSHNMNAVNILCQKALMLQNGEIEIHGNVKSVTDFYVSNSFTSMAKEHANIPHKDDFPFFVKRISVKSSSGIEKILFSRSENIIVDLHGEVRKPSNEYLIAVDVRDLNDLLLFRTHDIEATDNGLIDRPAGEFNVRCIFPSHLFPPGIYSLGIITAIKGKRELQHIDPVLQFEIVQDTLLANSFIRVKGILTPQVNWII